VCGVLRTHADPRVVWTSPLTSVCSIATCIRDRVRAFCVDTRVSVHSVRSLVASTDQLLVPSYQRSTIGRRAFPIAGARVWNALPSDVTSAPSLTVFGRRLKTELFRRCYNAV